MIDTYIINLDRAKERWNKITHRLLKCSDFNIKRVAAIDGKYENFSHIPFDIHQTVRNFGQPLSTGTIGCYLSHVKVWEVFYNSQKDYCLVLEDDVTFDPHLLLNILKELEAIQENDFSTQDRKIEWDLCSLQLNHRGTPLPIKRFKTGHKLCAYLSAVTGAGAYILTKQGARCLLCRAFPLTLPVDHYYTKSHKLNLKFVGIEPRIVQQTSEFSFIEQMGREHLRNLSSWTRALCGFFRVKEEMHQALYNLRWSFPLYRQYFHSQKS
ncbi:glycosyltransferase family 25 protein [Holospora undulata]|uniref:Procollagen galactosyltransferase 1 n=1 Tax=Holospora undulata HU1 TaxID=1321371 RepID=A0A061JGH6_9PROT|nr:glycosyltransferase family 25 protein [Holospora undulata]ETZ05176.1 procollagen galactosyltransferase 1 [Holospora undulata HU1]